MPQTNLAANAFELVTSKKVLHVAGTSSKLSEEWIRTLRRIITQSQVTQGPLLDRVRERWGSSVDGQLSGADFYQVRFETKKPLGLVLERSSEWAIVKLSNTAETGVTSGSVLYTINDKAVTQQSYPETIAMLTGWQPPLVLGFRHSPRKRGWLSKQSRGRNSSVKNWKDRYFVLEGGRLAYYEDDQKGAEIKGDIQLMGSAVSLLSHSETGQFFCLRIVSGITSIVMQAKTVDDMMDWASVLYHASSIANGGGYLLEVEKHRLEKLAKVQEQEAAVKDAEEEAIARKVAEEKATAAAAAAAEAEAAAKVAAETAAAAAAAAVTEEEKKSTEAAAAEMEAQREAMAAESARLKAEQENAVKEAEESAARAADEEAKQKAAQEIMAAEEAKAAADAKAAEEARNKALEEQIKVEAAEVEAEEAQAVAEETAAAAGGAPAAPSRRRVSVLVNSVVDDDDSDEEDEEEKKPSGPVETLDEDPVPEPPPPAEAAAPAAAEPAAAPPAAAPPAAAPAPAELAPAAVAPPPAPVEVVPVKLAVSAGVEDMELTDDILDACFTNLNGGSPTGSLNPMQMSILVRLITKVKKMVIQQTTEWDLMRMPQ